IDLSPRQRTRIYKIGACDARKSWHLVALRKQAAVDVRKAVGEGADFGLGPVFDFSVHCPEKLSDHLVGVAGIAGGELLDCFGEDVVAVEDAGALSKKAEDEPCHELIKIGPPRFYIPIWVLFQQLDIKLVELVRRADIDRVIFDLPDGGDAGERQHQT